MANLSMHRSFLLALAFCLCFALLIAVPLVHGGVPAHHSLVLHGAQHLAFVRPLENCSSAQTGC